MIRERHPCPECRKHYRTRGGYLYPHGPHKSPCPGSGALPMQFATYVEIRARCGRLLPRSYDELSMRTLEAAATWLRGEREMPDQLRPFLTVAQREDET